MAKSTSQEITLKDWIIEIGDIPLAKLLRVTPACVRHWRHGRCLPRSREMFLINKYSHGRVTYTGIIDTFHKETPLRTVKK